MGGAKEFVSLEPCSKEIGQLIVVVVLVVTVFIRIVAVIVLFK